MLNLKALKIITAFACLLACTSCTSNVTSLIPVSGYDAQGIRTGSVLPPPGTFTPY